MNRAVAASLFALSLAATLAAAQDTAEPPEAADPTPRGNDEPLRIDQTEKATVRLVLVDVLVLDKQDGTVAGLGPDDFEVRHEGRPVTIDSVDESCNEGSRADPDATRFAEERAPVAAPEGGRRIAFALDYQHIGFNQRSEVFDHARKWLSEEMTEGDEVLLAALTGGVRVEQPFTSDPRRALQSLQRMEHDITLWNANYVHVNEIGWVGGVTSLLDVLEQTPGRKAMVLYSAMGDVPLDLQFNQIAGQAAAARCAIYPVDAAGMARGGALRLAAPGSLSDSMRANFGGG